ncbi:MAG: (Na+)-NQR maturation NqrM [Gammaproteobacteria bacterium]|nr:(Na+)-NQR maturation NqrM [Gammaproteobacteria bacterium]
MIELLASILVFALAVAGLGLGILRGRRGIQGSCGGLNNLPGIASDCHGACRRPCRKRRQGSPAPNA